MGLWRLVLAWLVIAGHTTGYDRLFTADIGTIAVAAFLFISGFLMPLAYRTHYKKASFRDGCRRFYLNRFLRIFPVYWASLCLFLAFAFAAYARHGTINPALKHWPTYAQNVLLLGLNETRLWGGYFRFNNPAWSLDVELQYYLLVPLLVVGLSRFRSAVVTSLVILSIGSIYLFFRPLGLPDVDRSILGWAVFFFMGFAFHESPALQRLFGRGPQVLSIAIVALIAAVLSNSQKVSSLAAVIAFIAVSAYLLVMQKDYRFGPADRLAGELSYPAYIFHFLFLGLTSKFLGSVGLLRFDTIPQFVITLLANIVVTTVLAYIAYRVISEPIDRFRASIRGSKTLAPAPIGH